MISKTIFFSVLTYLFTMTPLTHTSQGLTNTGNSCFINAAVQCIFAMERLTSAALLYQDMYIPHSTAKGLIDTIRKSQQSLQKAPLDMEKFSVQAWNGIGAPLYTQQDSGELLQALLNGLISDDIKPMIKKDFLCDNTGEPPTELSTLFKITLRSQLRSPLHNFTGRTALEPSNALTISIHPGDFTLYQSLKHFFDEEQIDFTLSSGKVIQPLKSTVIAQLGHYLIINLKRNYSFFNPWENKLEIVRDANALSFPMYNLILNPYLHASCENKNSYNLLALILHEGSAAGGHYTAYKKIGEQWYSCNDSTVKPVPVKTIEDIALNGFDGTTTKLVTTLIYELSTTA